MHDLPVRLHRSIRTKIVLVSLVVEVTMLALLLANSVRLLDRNLQEHVRARLESAAPLLNSALSARLFERDHGSIQQILKNLVGSKNADFRYIVVYDQNGTPYASAGQIDIRHMPELDRNISGTDLVFDARSPVTLGGERVGEVRYGVSLAHFAASRDSIFTQGLIIASAEVVLSVVLLGLAGLLLTRNIRSLVTATQKIAGGDYTVHIPVQSQDEIGLLADNFNRMSVAVRDQISALHHSEQALFAEKERAEITLKSIGDGVITVGQDSRVQYLNPAAETLTGWRLDQARGRPVTEVYRTVDEVTRAPVGNSVQAALARDTTMNHPPGLILLNRNGSEYAVEETAAPILDRDGQVSGVVLVFHDVTAAREFARRLEYQANHDALTGLVNRREFRQRVERALQEARDSRLTHAMFYLDLDQFKVVNDTCGHNAGDELLRQLAALLRRKIRDTDVIGRLGGDEFGVLIHRCPPDQAWHVAENLRDSVRAFRFLWENKSFDVGVSIGVVAIDPNTVDAAELFSAADIACYVAKDGGRNQIHVHQPDDLDLARRRGEMHWSTRIATALNEGRFSLYYQKIIPLAGRHSDYPGIELLLRMQAEDGSLVLPERFIPSAERYQHMLSIDKWVLRRALALMAEPVNDSFQGMFSINVSGQSLGSARFSSYVIDVIRASGIEPRRICFEVTETAAVANLARAAQFMQELHDIGCRFALDDFGSGLSSFAYLRALPVDYLKIDGIFVRHILDNPNDLAMVTAINQMGRAVGIRTIAEFVEDDRVQQALCAIGIDYAQGFHIHTPQPLSVAAGRL